MDKTKINYGVDFLLAVVFVANLVSIWMGQYEWHSITGYLFLALIIIHLALHWSWIKVLTKTIVNGN